MDQDNATREASATLSELVKTELAPILMNIARDAKRKPRDRLKAIELLMRGEDQGLWRKKDLSVSAPEQVKAEDH